MTQIIILVRESLLSPHPPSTGLGIPHCSFKSLIVSLPSSFSISRASFSSNLFRLCTQPCHLQTSYAMRVSMTKSVRILVATCDPIQRSTLPSRPLGPRALVLACVLTFRTYIEALYASVAIRTQFSGEQGSRFHIQISWYGTYCITIMSSLNQ